MLLSLEEILATTVTNKILDMLKPVFESKCSINNSRVLLCKYLHFSLTM